MYSTRAGLVLGFHGCDQAIVDAVTAGKTTLQPSTNNYDWLGHGIYFWEQSPQRALDFADRVKKKSINKLHLINKPGVTGAVIQLGFCLDLLAFENLCILKQGYDLLKKILSGAGKKLPLNRAVRNQVNNDLLIRELDCAVIQMIHQFRKSKKIKPYDSVRAVFFEGNEIYPTAGIR